MSKGPGIIERKVVELVRKSGADGTDRSFTVAELCREVFGTDTPTRAQRVSVVRAARTAMRREEAASSRKHALGHEAWRAAVAKFGEPKGCPGQVFLQFLDQHPSGKAAARIRTDLFGLGAWRETARKDRTLEFHEDTRPARVWAVAITREGLVWEEAEIVKITASRISVVYRGVRAPLHRPLNPFGAWWRGVRFVGERTGRTARVLEKMWREQFGHLLPNLPMSLEEARQLLGVRANYTEDDVIAAFRRGVKRCHPDVGGTAEQFHKLVEARDRLLASLGTSAPAPKTLDFTPSGYRVRYVRARSYTHRIGGGRKLLGSQ